MHKHPMIPSTACQTHAGALEVPADKQAPEPPLVKIAQPAILIVLDHRQTAAIAGAGFAEFYTKPETYWIDL